MTQVSENLMKASGRASQAACIISDVLALQRKVVATWWTRQPFKLRCQSSAGQV
jgi:hypothetical protein